MDTLPNELLLPIYAYLPVSDFLRSLRVCKLWSSYSSNIWIWNEFLIRDFDARPVKTTDDFVAPVHYYRFKVSIKVPENEEGARHKYRLMLFLRNTEIEPLFVPTEIQDSIIEMMEDISKYRKTDQGLLAAKGQGTSTALSLFVLKRAFRIPESNTYIICNGRRAADAFMGLITNHKVAGSLWLSASLQDGTRIELLNGSSIHVLNGSIIDRSLIDHSKTSKALIIADSVELDGAVGVVKDILSHLDVIKKIGMTILSTSFSSSDSFELSKYLRVMEEEMGSDHPMILS